MEGRRSSAGGWRSLGCAVALAGCALPTPSGEGGPAAPTLPPGPLAIAVGGLPAADPGDVARVLTAAGARAANAPCALLRWVADPTRGAAREAGWTAIDAWVHGVQDAGIEDVALCLEFDGAGPYDGLVAPRSPLPGGGDGAALAAWVGRVVERYDADGVDDAEGLAAPVRRFRLGSDLEPGGIEPFGAFPGLLADVQAAMRAASPEARLVLPPLRARGEPPGPLAWRLDELLAASPRPFDAWSVAASGTSEELDAWLRWLRGRAPDVPIEVVEGTAPPLAEAGAVTRCDASAPDRARLDGGTSEAERCIVASLFVDLLARSPGTTAWARGIAARDLGAKAVLAAAHGVTRAELGLAQDAPWWTDPSLEAGAGLAAWSGLLDPGSGGAYPSFYALRQLDAWTRGRDTIVRLSGFPPGVEVFELYGRAGAAWIAWYSPPGFVPLGQPLPVRSAALDVGADLVWLEQLIVEPGTTEPLADAREVAAGRLFLDLTPTPLLVTPDPDGGG